MPEKHAGVRSREGRYFEVFWPPSKQFFVTQPASKPGFPPHPSTRRLFVQANPSHSCGLHVLQPSQCTTRAQRALAAAEFTAWRRDQQLSPPLPGQHSSPNPAAKCPQKYLSSCCSAPAGWVLGRGCERWDLAQILPQQPVMKPQGGLRWLGSPPGGAEEGWAALRGQGVPATHRHCSQRSRPTRRTPRRRCWGGRG